jgi:saccharopine dehydrogenase-like NADP-dependent oxidoreductase
VDTLVLDANDPLALRAALAGRFAVLSAAPYQLTLRIAEAARDAGVHYLDLTEDVASSRAIRALADGATTAFIPQCGLAPGFISIVAADLARGFDSLDSVRMRVGALPAYPSNALNYNLTWSTDGVINEYCEPCEAIVDGQRREVQALEEREEFSLDGVLYEAFNTSGGLGTLCETLAGRVRTLNYRTIRYPGHAAIMKALLHDLRLRDRRDVLKDILEQALPTTMQDVVIVFVTVAGLRDGRLQQDTYARKIYSHVLAGQMRSAIQITTASSLCAMLDLLAAGALPQRGFVRQEDVPLAAFLDNRFGHVYAMEALARAA